MKKFAKFLSILLCVAMLAGLVAMVATAEEGTRDPSEAVASALPTPDAGYYDGDNNFVSAHYQYDDKYIDLNKLVDGEPVERTQEEMDADYTPPVSKPSDADRIAALEEELAAAKILLGVE